MFQELKFQLSTAILTILTIAATVSAIINFQQQHRFRLADDGAVWVDRGHRVEALHIDPDGPAAKAGLKYGDTLLKINDIGTDKAIDVPQILARVGAWNKADYTASRQGVEFKAAVYVREEPLDPAVSYQYMVGAAYLLIGLFVYYRRGSAHMARHFYVLCLASFILCCFHYTGKLNGFDKVIYFCNVAAGLLAPTIFLHFCLTFPEPRRWFRPKFGAVLLYLPPALIFPFWLAVTSGTLQIGVSPLELRWMLDRIWQALLVIPYLLGGLALSLDYRKTDDPIVRQQLKWLRNGTFCGILPFTALYVLPYALGMLPNQYMRMSVLSLALIPLTLAYAIARYRLMDVDILFRRGYAYTLATVCVLAAFYGIVFSLGSLVQKNFKDVGNTGLIAVMLVAAFLFQPIRNWIQERLDKHFYRDRYDYRRTLVEFARELNAETDLDAMLNSVCERLLQTLSIRHMAVFLAEERPGDSPTFRLKMCMGARRRPAELTAAQLDLSFLNWELPQPYLFFERTRHQLDAVSRSWPATVRAAIADLDLTYYLPCTVRGRTIAYLGASRTEDGDFLSTVDVELLATISGYVGIAIENATLYRSLQRKMEEYERLKEFSENIVESINVGILAADLEDRVESWNTQIEKLTGIQRQSAVGRKLAELFPADLSDQFERVRGQTGIHHIYKFVLHPTALSALPGHDRQGVVAINGVGQASAGQVGQALAGQAGQALAGRQNGASATLNVAIAPLVSKDLEQIGRLIIFDDVTDRAELEQRLVQADKLSSIGLLAAGVAHEVNTPLAVISTYAQMLAKQVANDDQKSILLDKIAKQTFRASEIVNSLLNFSRTSTTSFGDVDLNKVVRETMSLLEHQIQKVGVEVKMDLAAGLPPVHGNAGKLQQVFLNLFLNARDAMDGGGVLSVRTWAEESGARVDVSDTGHGISPEHIQRIYDPFFTTKGSRKGTGMGLAVTYGIVQEHKGSIEVSSRQGGTRFHLRLPWSRTAAAQPSKQPVNAA
ncbi:MAG: ATP-binding protein [Bryobacteraceae bacterium]|jgi:signal transduction histidine kinase